MENSPFLPARRDGTSTRLILGIDPSSTRTGYALLESGGAPRIIEAGYLTGRKTTDNAMQRILGMRASLIELIATNNLTTLTADRHPRVQAVVEIPSGKVGSGQRRGASASAMAIYGMAVGMILITCIDLLASNVVAIDERTWTGRVSKLVRQRHVAAEFPGYREIMRNDGGADVADAIGLALWGIAQKA